MEEEDGVYRAPYWLPSGDSFRRTDSFSFSFRSGTSSTSFRSTGSYSFAFSSGTGFVILMLAATVAFLPSLSSSFSFSPRSEKSSWDYLYLLLVFCAILCGYLNRNSKGAGDCSSSYAASLKSNSSTPRSSSFSLMSSSRSSSDLDLRHIDDRRRLFDDTEIYQSRRWTEEEEHEERIHDAVTESQTESHSEPIEEQVRMVAVRTYSLPPPPPPPPPPSPPPLYDFNCEKMSGSAATKDFLTAVRKKKKQRQKSIESFDIDSLFGSSSDFQLPPQSPPPPPPPPSRVSKTRSEAAFPQSHPNRPITTRSPLIPNPPLPPPPPPPPFKVPDWKFVMRGDYVRLESANSSRRSWPDPIDDMEVTQSGGNSPSTSSVGSNSLAFFCPSPDVNTKADDFIASFWAGIQLEKANSLRRRTESNLGPDPILDPGPAL